jgi:8-amino-7-oxononanoate synthase
MIATTEPVTTSLDVLAKTRGYRGYAEVARGQDEIPFFRIVESEAGPLVRMEDRERLMFGSNNYLGLTGDARVCQAARDALDTYGTALTGSRIQNGTVALHVELEHEIADWLGTEDAVVFTAGYLANVGCLSALLSSQDTAILDSADHASLFDGCRLAGARLRPYRSGRLHRLEAMLERSTRDQSAALVMVTSILSMQGTAADLPAIADACERHGARLMVDEAHAIGVMGERGTGLCELHGLEERVDLRMGTFSKALASCGGFVAGDADAIGYLRFHARAFLFTVSAVPAAIGAALAAIRICRSDEGSALMAAVRDNAAYLRRGLAELGYSTPAPAWLSDGSEPAGAIVPVAIGDEARAGELWKALWDEGLYANLAIYPAVPPGQALIRLSAIATHRREHLDRALDIFERLRPRFAGVLEGDR